MKRLLAFALLAAVLAGGPGCSRRTPAQQLAAWNAEIAALEAERDSLRARAAVLVAADPRIQRLPKGDVVISVPTAFLRSVIERVFADVANQATLRIGGIKAHVAKKIKKIVTIGEFVVDVDIHEVLGKLKPMQPKLAFANDVVSMSLPVEVSSGRGEATIHFVWNGKNVADVACGDLDITQKVTGNVIPARYVIAGRLKLAARGNEVVCTPVFPETRVRIRVRPTKASWAAIDAILAEKRGVCGWVLDKVDVPALLTDLVETKGFNVKLPISGLKPFVVPGGLSDSLQVGDRTIAIAAELNTIRVDEEAIWYGASVATASR